MSMPATRDSKGPFRLVSGVTIRSRYVHDGARLVHAEGGTGMRDIRFATRPNGKLESYVVGGLDVWEYVSMAEAFDWDVSKTAEYLSEPEHRVRAALDYYRSHPQEVDLRRAETRLIEKNIRKLIPNVEIVSV